MSRTVAYISSMFPLPSETFVYREVRGLRRMGWRVPAISLNPTPANLSIDPDLLVDRTVLYTPATIGRIIAEKFTHPLRALKTMFAALGDMIFPGEPMRFGQRLKIPFQAMAAIGLARLLRREGVSRIHCHFAHAPTTVGMYAAMQLGIPFSFTGHANDLFQRRALLKKKLQRADFVACISRWHRDWYQTIWPDNAGKYEVIRCGVNVDQFHPATAAHFPSPGTPGEGQGGGLPGEDRTDTSKPPPHPSPGVPGEGEKLRIVTLCRLVEKKGVDTLIRAAAELRKKMDLELVIAGNGPDEARLRSIAGDAAWIKWLGAVDNSTVPKLFNASDIFALPCRADSHGDKDGIPVVLMEAMACGLPAVSGDLPAIRELIEDGVNGMLVDGNNPTQLAARLESLAKDPALRSRLGIKGREHVIEEFAETPNLRRLEKRFLGA